MRTNTRIKCSVVLALAAATLAGFVMDSGCQSGWALALCVERGASILPAYGRIDELLVSEILSLATCLVGVVVCLMACARSTGAARRLSAVFVIFFVILVVCENNLMRDDLRAEFLIVLLVWITIELLVRRLFAPIALLALACVIPALGQLGDHTAQVQFENLFGEDLFASSLAPLARTFGWLEEPLELAGSALFVVAALAVLEIRPPTRRALLCLSVAALAVAAIALGNSLLHVPDDELHDRIRKIGLFGSVAGVACASAGAVFGYGRGDPVSRAHAALFTLACYWIAVYAPTVAAHQHSKTISSWLWIFPVLAGYVYMAHGAPARPRACEPPG